MKRIVVVLIIAAVALCAIPVFADDATGGERSFFQKLSDEINGGKMSERFAVKPVAKDTTDAVKYLGDCKVPVFQDTAKAIAEESAKAKAESLRAPK